MGVPAGGRFEKEHFVSLLKSAKVVDAAEVELAEVRRFAVAPNAAQQRRDGLANVLNRTRVRRERDHSMRATRRSSRY